eukprot:27144_2
MACWRWLVVTNGTEKVLASLFYCVYEVLGILGLVAFRSYTVYHGVVCLVLERPMRFLKVSIKMVPARTPSKRSGSDERSRHMSACPTGSIRSSDSERKCSCLTLCAVWGVASVQTLNVFVDGVIEVPMISSYRPRHAL